MFRFRCNFLFAFFLVQSIVIHSQQVRYSKEIEDKITLVEKSLSGWVVSPDSNWNLQGRMTYHNIHGVSIAVIHNYKLEWARGYGWADTSDKRPVTNQTLFQAASISKSLNAVGALRLVKNKKLDLAKDINSYLTSWKFPYDTSKTHNSPITVTHLLSHTAGLSVHGFPGYKWTDGLPTDDEILDGKAPANTAAVRSEFEPGRRVKYSGGGTTISKKIIMDISGEGYDEFMAKEVLQPLGMSQSFYNQPPPPGSFPYLATAYYRDGTPISGKFHIYPEQAADGLWTNPTELAKYIIEMQLTLEGKSSRVLSKELVQTMFTPTIDNAALGVFIETRGSRKYFGHGGSNAGFRCQYYGSLDRGDGVVVMVNSDNAGIIPEIINGVASVYGWTGFSNRAIKQIVPVNVDTLATYIGTYNFETTTLQVTQKDQSLFLSQNESNPVRMYFTSPTDFFIKEVSAEFRFQKNEQGIVDAILIKQSGREISAKRKL